MIANFSKNAKINYCKGWQLEFNTLQKGMPTIAKIQKRKKVHWQKKSTSRAFATRAKKKIQGKVTKIGKKKQYSKCSLMKCSQIWEKAEKK